MMATSRQQMQNVLRSSEVRSPEEQNAVNARLIKAMLKRDKPAFHQALAEGADPNAIGVVLSPRGKPTTNPALLSAMFTGEIEFVTTLIAKGADVTLPAEDNMSAISLAIQLGRYDMVETVLQANPGVIDSNGNNLIMEALLSFSAPALIKHSMLTEAKRNALLAYYNGTATTVPGIETMELNYGGNLDVLRVLLKHPTARRLLLAETTMENGDTTPWELIQNPRNYIQDFLDPGMNPRDTVRCLTEPGDPDPKVVRFAVQFRPQAKRRPTDPTPPWVKVCCDFSDLIEEWRPIIKDIAPSRELADRVEVLHQNVQLVHRQVARNHPFFQEIENLSPSQGRLFDALAKHLSIMLGGYQTMSSGLAQRNQNTKMDKASTILSFIAGQAPSPWGAPFGIVSVGLSIAADRREKQRYLRIAEALPAESHPVAQELAYKMTCMVEAKLASLPKPGSLDTLTPSQVDALAKRAFVLAINVIHNLKDTDIDKTASASKKADELMTLVLHTVDVDHADFLNALIIQTQCPPKNVLIFSLAANGNGTNGHGHSHNGNAGGYHPPRNGQTEVNSMPAKGKRKHPSPEKKCILM